jgi:hypothetical protein
MRRVRIALAAGLLLTAAALVAVLSQSPTAVLATNSIPTLEELAQVPAAGCQEGERLPAGTRAIRLSMYAFTGPRVRVEALAGTRVLASGEHGAGWSGATVTVPVSPVVRTASPVRICFTVSALGERATAYGRETRPAQAVREPGGQVLPGRLSVEYLGAGHASWLSLVPTVARHMALGRAWSGIWVVYLLVLLMASALAVAMRVAYRELGGSAPEPTAVPAVRTTPATDHAASVAKPPGAPPPATLGEGRA